MIDPLDAERIAAESAGAQARFEFDPTAKPTAAPSVPTKVRRDWADGHLSQYADAETRTANLMRKEAELAAQARVRRRRTLRRWLIGIGCFLALGAGTGAVTVDYLGIYPLGFFHRQEMAPRTAPPTHLVSFTPSASEPAETPAAPAQPAADPVAQRRRADRIAHLDAGVSLMKREQDECDRIIAVAQLVLAVRPPGRLKPWSSAECLDELAQFVRLHPNLTALEHDEAQKHYDQWTADVFNARQRIAEQEQKKASLQERIEKAKAEREQEQVPAHP